MKIIFSFCFLTVCLLPLSAQDKLQPKVLIIMIDGMRADAYDNIPMPNLEKLRAGKWQPGYNGAFSATGWDIDDARPNSAPNHAAIATGVTATKHKVFKNGQTKDGNFEEWPSWLARLATSPQHYKTQFLYSWGENKDTAKHPDVPFRKGKDPDNGDYLCNLYASPDGGPDAVLFFIGEVDHSGHSDGFYPHSQKYINTAIETDVIIGKLLDTIAARPTFANEDWLILITSDHGGYGKSHGMLGGHANTIPILMVGKHITQGTLPGLPRNYDMPVTALAHFGVDVKPLNLDGHVIGTEVSKI
ncbi:MAG: alkaline phosphatase family protein, partial [Victivallales bacterium]|nr:alkaline phosphatase family protein [Victivallales bacterium]